MKSITSKASNLLRSGIKGRGQIGPVEQADQARDAGRWREAAELYAKAFIEGSRQPGLLVQEGNCHKEAGDFSKAYDAYCRSRTLVPTADCDLQIGHLLKISGNYMESILAYRRAAQHGDDRAEIELAALTTYPPKTKIGPGDTVTTKQISATLDAIAAISFQGCLNATNLRRAAQGLLLCGESACAKAFYQLAYLAADFVPASKEHLAAILSSSLWPRTHLTQFTSAESDRASLRPSSARDRLRKLIGAAVKSVNANAAEKLVLPRPVLARNRIWPRPELSASVASRLLPRLTGAIDKVYELIVSCGQQSGKEISEALLGLESEAEAASKSIFFVERANHEGLRLAAVAVLNNCTHKWLAENGGRFAGPFTNDAIIGVLASLGGDPFAERLTELGSAEATWTEIHAQVSALIDDLDIPRLDSVLAGLFSSWWIPASVSDVSAFICAVSRHDLPKTIRALISRPYDPPLRNDDALALARLLKHRGYAKEALDLMDSHYDDETSTFDQLVEKAILFKILGNFDEAVRIFEICAQIQQNNVFVRRELAVTLPEIESIDAILARYRTDPLFMEIAPEFRYFRSALGIDESESLGSLLNDNIRDAGLAPELAYEFQGAPEREQEFEAIRILDLGWLKRADCKITRPLLRAIDFVRVQVASLEKIAVLRVRIDGRTIATGKGVGIPVNFQNPRLHHEIFNCWLDLSRIEPGLHELQLYFEEAGGGYRTKEELVWIDPGARGTANSLASFSEALIVGDGVSLETRISRAPSVVFDARRSLFGDKLNKILVIRADQLGDTTQSLGAMAMIRDAFPHARLEALTSRGNVDLLCSTGIFDEVHSVELTYEIAYRRRYASLAEQIRIRDLFAQHQFDLAVDLSPGFDTQNLLRLVNARHTAGFKPNEFRWMTFGVDVQTHDPINGKEIMPHSAQIVAFVASLIAMANHKPFVQPKPEADWQELAPFNIRPGEQFAVLHSGARLEIKRWPLDRYVELARLMSVEAGIKTILLADDPDALEKVDFTKFPPELLFATSEKLPFRRFDALLSLCALFVGNDTGPKHLAAFRGAPVVSVHMGQVNWNEWGQDATGFIVARRVPCVGCGIERVEECGKGLPCLLDIQPIEVYRAAMKLIDAKRSQPAQNSNDTELCQ